MSFPMPQRILNIHNFTHVRVSLQDKHLGLDKHLADGERMHTLILTSISKLLSIVVVQSPSRLWLFATPWTAAMVFPVVMCGCESWTIKKAECQRIDALELWCWRRLFRVPWTASWSNQSILKEINPEYALEGLMLKPKLQYFGHLMRRTDWLEKTLMLGKTEGRRSGWQRMRWLWANSRR